MESILLFSAAILLDLLFGDPRWYPHPVRLIGGCCTFCEKLYRKIFPHRPAVAGISSGVTVLVVTLMTVLVILLLGSRFGREFELFFAVLLLYTAVAIRDLLAHSRRVYRELCKENNLRMARREVSMIVGRDTAALDEPGIIRACVETVAENMADGIIAPLFWAMAAVVVDGIFMPMNDGGLEPFSWAVVGAFFYKACNTMDSMYGYKNTRYIDFGRFAARLDDLVNYLPARITSGFLVVAAPVLGLDGRAALRILLRDRGRHTSPNAGYPEAAMAGALGVQLGGPGKYFGRIVEKPTLGDARRGLERADILRANRLVFAGSILFILVCCLFFAVFSVFFH